MDMALLFRKRNKRKAKPGARPKRKNSSAPPKAGTPLALHESARQAAYGEAAWVLARLHFDGKLKVSEQHFETHSDVSSLLAQRMARLVTRVDRAFSLLRTAPSGVSAPAYIYDPRPGVLAHWGPYDRYVLDDLTEVRVMVEELETVLYGDGWTDELYGPVFRQRDAGTRATLTRVRFEAETAARELEDLQWELEDREERLEKARDLYQQGKFSSNGHGTAMPWDAVWEDDGLRP